MKRLLERNPLEWLTVPTIRGRITQQTLDVLRLCLEVTSAAPQKRSPGIAFKINGLSRPVIFGDMKDQHRLAVNDQLVFGDLDIVIDPAVGMEYGEERKSFCTLSGFSTPMISQSKSSRIGDMINVALPPLATS
jgi:hypothetical protein